ncbi:MAG: hypothetical protein WAN43_01850 [Rhodomicrobium sp.]|jgi:hypothetical protein
MPDYRATRLRNTREAETYQFSAKNDEEALEVLRLGENLAWSGDADVVEPDVTDEVLALDRRKDEETWEIVDDEIELPSERPYGRASRSFVEHVARLGEEGAYDDAVETLEEVIAMARRLCGIDDGAAAAEGRGELRRE